MLAKITRKIRNEYNKYNHFEKVFIFLTMVCSFCITAEAAITRSVSSSFFIDIYGPRIFPIAWVASVPLNYIIVYFYNRYIRKFGCKKMMSVVLLVAVLFNIYCVYDLKNNYCLPFFLHIWKDIFIIFMFHSLWSVINSTIKMGQAKYLYGIFYGFGGLGSIAGSLVPSFFAIRYGTEKLLLATLPLYFLTNYIYSKAISIRNNIADAEDIRMNEEKGNIIHGLQLIKNSSWLKFILFLVACMQVSSTLLEYQFNLNLEKAFSLLDHRTQFLGRMFGFVGTVNIFLQFFGGYLLVNYLGLRKVHFLIPAMLLSNSFVYSIFPSFHLICFSFGTIKCLDYTIFGIIKEMLYIPLSVEEKFQAKSIIDVFVYRSSKAIAALVVFFLAYCDSVNILSIISFVLIMIFFLWGYTVISMKEYFINIEKPKPSLVK